MKKSNTPALIVSFAALCVAVAALILTLLPAKQAQSAAEPAEVQYVLYLGTNDKDTNQPVGTPDEVKAKADEVLSAHFGGFTIQEANGGWVGDDGTVYHEYTLVILLSDTDEAAVHAAADDLIAAFNQSSVLIQANVTSTEFYYGN